MVDPLRVVAVADEPPLADDERVAVHAVADAGEATATLETSAVDCVLVGADWRDPATRVVERFPDVPVVVHAETGLVDLDAIAEGPVAGFVPAEAGSALLAHRLPELRDAGDEEAAVLDAESIRFRKLARSVGVGIVSIDADSVVQFANPAVEELLGWPPEELAGESLGVLIPDRLRSQHFEGVNEYLATGERSLDWSGVELPVQHREGHEREVLVSFGEFDHDGERYFTGVIAPVDVEADLREDLAAAYEGVAAARDRYDDEELAQAAETVDELLARLEQ